MGSAAFPILVGGKDVFEILRESCKAKPCGTGVPGSKTSFTFRPESGQKYIVIMVESYQAYFAVIKDGVIDDQFHYDIYNSEYKGQPASTVFIFKDGAFGYGKDNNWFQTSRGSLLYFKI